MFDKKGGNILASGGFGCVFSPALKCKGNTRQKKGILSKLMMNKYAKKEYEEITKIRKKVVDIPNYQDYFLVDNFTTCEPAPLTKADLSNYTRKCKALKKNGIQKNNINKQLDKLLILNMPNGGIPVDDYLQTNGSFYKLFHVNNRLIELLENAIVPMNNQHIYHCDIKDSNVLVQTSTEAHSTSMKIRMIDWGLSTEYIPYENNPFPKPWRNRPLQFNVPFSIVLFTDDFVKKYTKYLEEGGKVNESDLRPFLLDYLYYWFRKRGHGHYKFINEIMYILFGRELKNVDNEEKYKLIETEITMTYILNYLTDILLHYTKFREDGSLNLREYLDNVFINIVDIWGFVTIYIPILHIFNQNYNELTAHQMDIFELLKEIFIQYLYNPRIEPINLDNLLKDLRKLGKLFRYEMDAENYPEWNETRNINKYRKQSTIKSYKKTNDNKTSKLRFEKIKTKTNSKTKTRKLKTYVMISTKK